MSKLTFDFEFDPEELKRIPAEPTLPVAESPAPASNDEDAQATSTFRRISVHALGQFAFCPRSAVLAIERGDQEDVDETLPRLDYLPNFDLVRIEEALKAQIRWLWVAVSFLVMAMVPLIFGTWWGEEVVIYPTLGITVGLLWWIANLAEDVWILLQRRYDALHATAKEPSPRIDSVQEINWWEMIRAGFEPAKYERPFQHPLLPLNGSPWRVLERDSLRIPVIRSNGTRLTNWKGEVFDKHRVRLAAYSLLLESINHVESPYGLIFFEGNHRGLAVPITKQDRDEVHDSVERLRLLLKQSDSGDVDPSRPASETYCFACPHGKPVLLNNAEESEFQSTGRVVLVMFDHRRRKFHSECGDRFGSAPPHSQTLRRRLIAPISKSTT